MNKRSKLYQHLISVALAAAVLAPAALANASETLSADHAKAIFQEAQATYDKSAELLANDPAQARMGFANAAAKFQLLADADLGSGKLYYNLANAYLQSGQVGRAIANYKRAQQILGHHAKLTANLKYARKLRDKNAQASQSGGFTQWLAKVNAYWPTSRRLWTGLIAWCVLWLAMAGAVFMRRGYFKPVAITAAIVVLLAAVSVGGEYFSQAGRARGVTTATNTTVLKGNGSGFAPKFKEPLAEGTEFTVLQQRGQWLEVKLDDGKTGWIPANQAEVIQPQPIMCI